MHPRQTATQDGDLHLCLSVYLSFWFLLLLIPNNKALNLHRLAQATGFRGGSSCAQRWHGFFWRSENDESDRTLFFISFLLRFKQYFSHMLDAESSQFSQSGRSERSSQKRSQIHLSFCVNRPRQSCRPSSDEAVSYNSGNPRSATNVLLLFLLLEGPRQGTHPSLYKRKHMTSKWFVVGDHLTFPFGSSERCPLAFWWKWGSTNE